MEDPVNNPPIIVQPVAQSRSTGITVYLAVFLSIIISVVIVGVGLGVSLGVGLRHKSSITLSDGNRILAAPTVDCTYINSSTCGCAATKPTFLSSRIVSGYTTVAHSWPWTVILYNNGSQRCDGFLVTYEHVITAAHCVSGLTTALLQIYIGVHSRSAILDRQVRQVSKIQIHPDYSTTTYLNDIAIIKLAAKVTATSTVGLCCLPSDPSLPMEDEAAVIVGWGRTRADDSASVSDTLQQAVVQIYECDPDAHPDQQFCAGYSTSDSCQGDSGGPLMTNVNNLWTCTGIVSYGGSCGNGGYYTRVAYYRSFIDNAISSM